jgi:hypothetical protein
VGAGKHGDEMSFKCLDDPLGFVGTLVEKGEPIDRQSGPQKRK